MPLLFPVICVPLPFPLLHVKEPPEVGALAPVAAVEEDANWVMQLCNCFQGIGVEPVDLDVSPGFEARFHDRAFGVAVGPDPGRQVLGLLRGHREDAVDLVDVEPRVGAEQAVVLQEQVSVLESCGPEHVIDVEAVVDGGEAREHVGEVGGPPPVVITGSTR